MTDCSFTSTSSSTITVVTNEDKQQRAIDELFRAEPVFTKVVQLHGPPPLWQRPEGFATLIRIILEQQVSLASAKAAYDRLLAACSELTPMRFLKFTDQELKTIGFSRQKTRYGRHLALAITEKDEGGLDLAGLRRLDDEQVREQLTKVKGIGVWTANIYLLMAMQRPDVWPRGDIALAAAYQQLAGLDARPGNDEMELISSRWQPWRSVAARLLWHYYLSERAVPGGTINSDSL